MSKKHDAIFDDILKDMGTPARPDRPEPKSERGQARFLKRSTAMSEQASGERQEKVLRLVNPETCRMWDRHNRVYDQLTEENCRDLIDGLKSQGQQEFPAIVRRLRPASQAGQGHEYEVICGARRHFAITWLRANTYPQFRYLIEERDLTDEEAFRLADVENRDREDISDLERARDYASAVDNYYGGKQSLMAERLEVSPAWLSRYLSLARLDPRIVAAFSSIRDIKELHARQLKPLLATEDGSASILEEAERLTLEQRETPLAAPQVMARLKLAAQPRRVRKVADATYRRAPEESGIQMRRKGSRVLLEFDKQLSDAAIRAGIEAFLTARQQKST